MVSDADFTSFCFCFLYSAPKSLFASTRTDQLSKRRLYPWLQTFLHTLLNHKRKKHSLVVVKPGRSRQGESQRWLNQRRHKYKHNVCLLVCCREIERHLFDTFSAHHRPCPIYWAANVQQTHTEGPRTDRPENLHMPVLLKAKKEAGMVRGGDQSHMTLKSMET